MKILLRLLTIGAFSSLALLSTFAAAGEAVFDKAHFDKLMAEGKPVIVDFYADWCPTCKAQKPSVPP